MAILTGIAYGFFTGILYFIIGVPYFILQVVTRCLQQGFSEEVRNKFHVRYSAIFLTIQVHLKV